MSRGDKRWIVAGSLVVLAGLGWARAAGARWPADAIRTPPNGANDDGFQGFSSRPFSARWHRLPAPPATPEMIAKQVEATMGRWRTAILAKDAPTSSPSTCVPPDAGPLPAALAASAERDDNERVRAFSTRVLGKLKNPAEAPLYHRLLTDKSPFVRQNAAWALGELGRRPRPGRRRVAKGQRARSGERRSCRRQGRARKALSQENGQTPWQDKTKRKPTDRPRRPGRSRASRAGACSSPTAWPAARTVPGMESCEQFPKMS